MNTVVRDMLKSFTDGIDDLAKDYNKETIGFVNMSEEMRKTKHLDIKTKELISIAISTYARCEYSVVYHTYKALEAGATKEEIMESGFIATACGGEFTMAYMITLLKEGVEEFEKDFKRKNHRVITRH